MAKFNRGDVSEGILAAAITARFVSKTERINSSDVLDIIFDLEAPSGSKSKTTITNFISPNANSRIKDDVICKVNLAEINMNAFLAKSTYKMRDIMNLVDAAVSYANGPYIISWADLMYNNNQKNVIEVNAEGLLDQTGTKVDLKVVIDGKQAGVGISLKAGDVKQFGQVGGSKFESMVTLWLPFGVKFSRSFQNNYENMIADKQVAPALTSAYTEAAKQIKKKSQPELRKMLSKFMNHHATSGEKDVVLVQLNRSEAKVYDFETLERKLKFFDIKIRLTSSTTAKLNDGGFKGKSGMSKNKIPKIDFLIDNKVLLTIRLKLEGNRVNSKGKRLPLVVRSYVEKGPMTTQLITG